MGAPSGRPPPLCHCYLHAIDANKKRERPITNYTDHNPTRATKKKKNNTRRAGDLGVDVEQEVRVDEEVRVHEEENTRGNPNPKSGLGFPSA